MPQDLVICIQEIRTHWGKSARGGAEAVKRNHVPESLRLPPFQPLQTPLSYVTHRAYFCEANSYSEPTENSVDVSLAEPVKLGGLSLSFQGDTLAVFYQWDYSQGAPARDSHKKEALRLPLGQWGRVCYNGRHSNWEDKWWYEKRVYNLGLFVATAPSVFRKSKPLKVTSYIAILK